MSIRPTFMGYETAKSALNYSQKALDIVGHNISNGSTTTGYTRQRVEASSAYTLNTNGRIASSTTALAGQGVNTLGVSQTRDVYLDAAFRNQYSTASYYSESSSVLKDIQSALGTGADLTDTSEIFGALQGIYDSIYDFADDCTSESQANIVYTAFQSLVTSLNTTSKALTQARENTISNTKLDIDRVNSIVQNIANINDEMAKSAAYSMTKDNTYFYDNELMDQRNVLLDELAGYCDIRVTEHDDGTCDVKIAGHDAITGNEYNTLTMEENDNQTVSIKWLENGETLSASQGSLLADMEYVNGRGCNAQSAGESASQGYLYYQDRINTLAASVANIANHSIPQVDANGDILKDASGNITYKTLLGAKQEDDSVSPDKTITAENLSISEEWSKGGSAYFIYRKDEADYSYAMQLATQLTTGDYTFTSYGETFEGTFEEYISDYVVGVANDISEQTALSNTTSEIADDYLDARDEVSGVNQDEETTDMLSYQRIFQAASRVMTTMDELLDVIINRMAV